MKTTQIKTVRVLALLVAGLLAGTGAMAEKPDWAGNGKRGKSPQKQEQEHERRGEASSDRHQSREQRDRHFGDDQRNVVRSYYSEQYRVGRCPPGLAKKHNGCQPPGQARQWSVGRPLPREVVYYDLPASVTVQLGVPPSGHRYVRVASDILLIAVGTGMVLDGIEDLGRR